MKLRKSSQRHAFALAVACLVHVLLFSVLVLGRRPDPVPVEPPVFDVVLEKRLARPIEPPKFVHRPPPPDSIPPLIIPTPPPTPPVSDADRAALAAAPFKGFPGAEAYLRAQRSCLNGADNRVDEEACGRLFGEGPVFADGLEDPKGALAMALRRKAAIAKYKDSRDVRSYPGLKCTMGGGCDDRPWDGPLPGEIIKH